MFDYKNLRPVEYNVNQAYTWQTNSYILKTLETTEKGLRNVQKLTIKTPDKPHQSRFGVFIVNFEHFSEFFLVFQLLTLIK